MNEECCELCRYFTKIGDGFSTGTCDEQDVIAIVVDSDWCDCFELEELDGTG